MLSGGTDRGVRVLVYLSNAVRVFEPTEQQLEALRARVPGHEIVRAVTQEDFVAALSGVEAAVVWHFRPEWYALASRLQHLFTPSAGHEPLPPDPRGRVTQHFGSFHGAIMAESLLGMVLFMNRRFGLALQAQRERVWDRAVYIGTRCLTRQVALIIGFGAIGAHCGRLLQAVGMTVHGLRRDTARNSPYVDRLFRAEALLDAVSLADHVVCVLPSDTGTDGLIGSTAFECMKPNACLYNLGRGNAVDPQALLEALSTRRIAGAFLDVLPEEPLPSSSPLWNAPNLYLTPHASAVSAEYMDLYLEELGRALSSLP
jgi:D-2-hydroxyacid dehydrogenase (NADP+)